MEQPETPLKISYVRDVADACPNRGPRKDFVPAQTVLHWACEKGNLEVVKKILESGNWNLREKMEVLNMVCPEKGLGPLELARKNEHLKVANVSFLFSCNY